MNQQKGLAPILIVLLIALAVGGYLLYQKQPKSIPASQPSSSPAVSDQTANSDSIGANWKTYKDKKNNFEVKYPSSWFLIADNPPNPFNIMIVSKINHPYGTSNATDIFINVFDNPKNLTLRNFFKEISENPIMPGSDLFGSGFNPVYMKVDGKEAVKLIIPGVVFNEEVAIQSNGKILMVGRHLNTKGESTDPYVEKVFNQMIQTIRFLK